MVGLPRLGVIFGLVTASLAEPIPANTRKRPLINREGRFLSTHLDLLSAASSLFPSFMDKEDVATSKADKLVASEEDLTESDTIKDMSNNLEDVQSFGAKLNSEPSNVEEVIADQIDAMDASGGDPPTQFEEIFEAKTIPYQEEKPKLVEIYKDPKEAAYGRPSYGRPSYGKPAYGGYHRPEGTPVPLVIICEDPNYCPPPAPYGNTYGQPRPSYGSDLTICKDPNDCPPPYGNYPPPRPYRIKRPLKTTEQPPTYEPSNTTRRPVKKYGYNPKKSNPTIWRQQVMKVRKPAIKDEDRPEDVEEEKSEKITETKKLQEDSVKFSEPEIKPINTIDANDIQNMSMEELKEFIKEAAMQEVEEEKIEKLVIADNDLPTVAPVVEQAINKMSMRELKDFLMETVMENKEELVVAPINEKGIKKMSMTEMKELIKDTVIQNEGAEEIVVPLVEDGINKMSMRELKKVIMESVDENEDNEEVVVPLVEEAINEMSMAELKEFIADTVETADTEEVIAPLVEEAISDMSRGELKEFIMENVVESDELKTVKPPQTEDDINNMSMEELREFIEEAPTVKTKLDKITEPKNSDDINQMSMDELREFIENTNSEPEKVSVHSTAEDIKQMSMEELREFIDQNSVPPTNFPEEQMVKTLKNEMKNDINNDMIIRDGMLMKKGMTMKEIKAEEMGMTVKEMVSMVEGLEKEEVDDINDGVTVEEMIAMKNDVTVGEMISMKNDMSMKEVMEIKDEMTVEEVLNEKPQLEVEEVVALKSDMTVEEMVAMKNEISVEEVLDLKDDITMVEIMSLQDGMTKEDIIAVVEDVVTIDEVIEMKEKLEEMSGLKGIQIVPDQGETDDEETIMGMEGLEEMAEHMEIIDIDGPNDDGVKFIEIFNEPDMMKPTTATIEDEILEAVKNEDFQATRIPMRETTMTQKLKVKEEKKETRKKLKMKMRPMRVKVRKPAKNFQSFMMKENKKEPKPNLGFGDSSMGTMLDEEFGLKNGVTNEDLVLEPTPAVPGRPIILEDEEDPVRMRNKFNEFLPSTTPAPVIPVANIKTVDFQKEDMSNSPMDYPIYDTENSKPFPPIKMSEFPNMPIFSNFPMMAPNEFVQPSLGEGMEDHNLPGYSEEQEDYEDYMDKPSFTAFNEERPESINLFKEDGPAKDPPAADELESLVNRFNEEADIEAEIRPVRRPSQNPTRSPYNSVHPNHRYPLNRPTAAPAQVNPTPFTVRSRNTIVPHSYMKNSYKHTAADNNFRSGFGHNGNFDQAFNHPSRPLHSFGDFDTSNTALFREIPEPTTRNKLDQRYKRKPYQESSKPFTTFGKPREESIGKTQKRRKIKRPNVEFSKNYDVKSFTDFGQTSQEKSFVEQEGPDQEILLTGTPNLEAEDPKEDDLETNRDYNDPSLVGINFYKQYGQHDDRPLQLPTASSPTTGVKEEKLDYEDTDVDDEKPKRRPGEIRFGGMSFALPPPGAFPDIPDEEYEYESEYDYDTRPVSDVYPNHPVSAVFPNRPVSEVFRDLPNHQADPTFPTVFPTGQGISIVESDSADVPSFKNFFNSQNNYMENPFGGDFIKLEIDRDRFDTNKTKPGVHHIPLDVYGYPDVPTYKTTEESARLSPQDKTINEKKNSKPVKPLFSSKKPLYKPPPVLTKYEPPKAAQIPEYKHQYPTVAPAQKKSEKVGFDKPAPGSGALFPNVEDAMTNLPNALQNLPMFMERLMGNHADWVQRAWRGRERDESAAA